MKTIVRVAVNNNFNCTPTEWAQLNEIASYNPDKIFFINSNINTPKLSTVNDHPYKIVVTANPNITFPNNLSILTQIQSKIAFIRIKYVPTLDDTLMKTIEEFASMNIPVVITLQRFNSLKSIAKYTKKEYYKYSCGRFRLADKALLRITAFVVKLQKKKLPVWICDQAGTGCQGCGLCSVLTTGMACEIYSLNLSSSGICPYNCPDCYAKTMQNFCRKMGYKPIIYDVIKKNEKQSGRTAHIKEALKNAKR
jgi:hypothetical protein